LVIYRYYDRRFCHIADFCDFIEYLYSSGIIGGRISGKQGAGVAAFIVAALMVGWQSVKVASGNPVKILKND